MRASRLLRILLLLQNRGRQTAKQLADELEVVPRTIQRDIDALVEAGLPVVTHRGAQGGVELGFNYRTRLTGLTASEAESLGVMLARPDPRLYNIGLGEAMHSARHKLLESFPDTVRQHARRAQQMFVLQADNTAEVGAAQDERLPALAAAVRHSQVVRINMQTGAPRTVHPRHLQHDKTGWRILDELSGEYIALQQMGDINISASRFQ